MKLANGIENHGSTLILTKSKTLIISDLHLGAESVMHRQGLLIPKTQTTTLHKQLDEAIAASKPRRIILNGDIKHAFGTILEEEWRDTLRLIDHLQTTTQVSIITGNHDQQLAPIAKKRGLTLQDHELIGKTLIIHGDRTPEAALLQRAERIIIGHEHPAVNISNGIREERYKAFLTGTYHGKKLIVMPSSYPLVEGSDATKDNALGPILKEAKKLHAYLIEEETTYDFGPLRMLPFSNRNA